MSTPPRHKASCPYCESDIWLDAEVDLWAMVTCQNCATELEVVSLDPPILDYYWQEDWEDDEEEYETYYAFGADDQAPPDWDDGGPDEELYEDGD